MDEMAISLDSMIESLYGIANMSDEEAKATGSALIETLDSYFHSPEHEREVNNVVNSYYNNGATTEQVDSDMKKLIEAFYYLIEGVKKNTENISVERQEILDKIYSLVEAYYIHIGELFKTYCPVVKFKLLHENAKLPTYAHPGDQGADVYAIEDVTLPPHCTSIKARTGLAAIIPNGWAISIRQRSGMSAKTGVRISNCPATIDTGYRNEIGLLFDNLSDEPYTIHAGDRVAQFILEKNYRAQFEVTEDVQENETERNVGGFGSSGV